MAKPRRRKFLIEPRVQIPFLIASAAIATSCIFLSGIMFGYLGTTVAADLPNDGLILERSMGNIVPRGVLLTSVIMLPVAALICLFATFRIAGPIYRIRTQLTRMAEGENPAPFDLRAKDELRDLCGLVNRIGERLSASGNESDSVAGEASVAETASMLGELASEPETEPVTETADDDRAAVTSDS